MIKDRIIEKVLSDMSVDPRITDGMFNIKKNEHVGYLSEYLIGKGIDSEIVYEFCDLLMEKGKYPERQAYNRKGILVTFPTPEYKKAAIQAGTHFEEDPTRGHPNIFAGDDTKTGTNASPATSVPPATQTGSTKTNLPISTSTAAPPTGEKDGENTSDPAQPIPNAFTTAAPQQSPSTEQPTEPTKLPPPKPIVGKEKELNKDVIKKILKGDDYMLEEVIQHIIYNVPYIMEEISKKHYE